MLDVKSRLQDLKSVAEKLAIEIEIVNLNNQEFQMQSGYCKMNGEDLILLDKNISLQEQSEILLQTLKNFEEKEWALGVGQILRHLLSLVSSF